MRRLDLVNSRYYTVACIVFVSVFFMFSCSSEATFEKPQIVDGKKLEISELNLSLDLKDGVISFENDVAFQNAVSALKKSQSNENLRSSVVNNANDVMDYYSHIRYESRFPKSNLISKYGFYSLYDYFVDAMEEAEAYYEREGGYQEFKKKYSTLFYPELDDDYSAYLPVSDKEIAKLLNVKGEIIIGGEVKNLIDITSYEQLRELGLVPSHDSEWITLRGGLISSPLGEPNVEPRVTVLNQINCNDRRLWIEAKPTLWGLVLETHFQKKTLLVWHNYSSVTYMKMLFYYPNDYGVYLPSQWTPILTASGNSPHIAELQRLYTASGQPIRFVADGQVQFQGFGAQCGHIWYSFSFDIP